LLSGQMVEHRSEWQGTSVNAAKITVRTQFLEKAILDCVLPILTILCTKETSGQSMKDISSVQQQGETGFKYPTEAQQQQGVRGH
jgi:hypothetical protein